MEILGAVLELAKFVFVPICDCCNYHRHVDEHILNLRDRCQDLNGQMSDIESRLRAQLRPGKTPKVLVTAWIQQVERMNSEIQAILSEADEVKCFLRARIGKRAMKMNREADVLYQRGGAFPDSLVLDPPASNGEEFPTKRLIGKSTERVKEKILACVLGNGVGKTGVCGMGGIGKSTMMEHINNDLLKDKKKFDSVVWVTVSKSFNVIQLQNDIAHKLALDLPELGDIRERAAMLKAEFEKRKRYVLILDDLWEPFALEDVGIPEPTSANGCKIVLTTRKLEVCRGMSCEVIKMELLSKEEAQELFVHIMGSDVFGTPHLKAYAEEVLQTCAQLPLAIVTIAGSFKLLVHDYEWRDALERLRTSLKGFDSIEKQVHEVLKFSYERLKEEKLKQCLLHCALYPEDYEIYKERLIEELIDEGIIERMKSRQAEFDRGYSMLSKLENACLLEGVIDKYYVKMHDLVRDMVLQVACPEFMVGHLGLEDVSDEGKWRENLVKASLLYDKISRIPSNVSPMCPNLSTLSLQGNQSLKNVPDSLFEHLHRLKVLDLSDTGIESLSNSVYSLENLNILRLRWCRKLKHVSSLAKLTTLRKLDLGGTSIAEVPDGLEMLVNLTYLNLWEAWNIKIMPLGILPKLSHLQYLRLPCQVTVKGEEMERLKKLENVWVRFDDLYVFCTFMRSLEKRQLASYQILVGRTENIGYGNVRDAGKGVILGECNLGQSESSLVLPEDVQFLDIVDRDDLTSLCDVPALKHVRELKEIGLGRCNGIEHVLSSVTDSLQTLEILRLWSLYNLRGLFRKERAASARVPPNNFSCLKKIDIQICLNIKKLLPPLLHLRNLEEIFVDKCYKLEEIIGEASDEFEEEEIEEEGMDTTKITLPNLRLLSLGDLPELKTICSSTKVIVCDSLEQIDLLRCPKLKRLPLFLPLLNGQLSPPPSLQGISADNEGWWESLEWDSPDTKRVLQPFVNFSKAWDICDQWSIPSRSC
ncbi:hypothetical protein RGQ29_027189 [Quercus rubra]|uniref:NB-ARC domain-containing protein n=1 Tax=Quercus rubra TaxID=3512 RepID=A0AAN7EPP4_QUERU|nr:hypothetical protein RGQ29_027189 [Quercus rubra]KAK4576537.1 hypothetical protein RGQ29_027189 [Quercus rubra]